MLIFFFFKKENINMTADLTSYLWGIALLTPLTEFEITLTTHFYLSLVMTLFLLGLLYIYQPPINASTLIEAKNRGTFNSKKEIAPPVLVLTTSNFWSTASIAISFYLSLIAGILTVAFSFLSTGLLTLIDALTYGGESPWSLILLELALFLLCFRLHDKAKNYKQLPVLQAVCLVCCNITIILLAFNGILITAIIALLFNLIASILSCCLILSSNPFLKAKIDSFYDKLVNLAFFKQKFSSVNPLIKVGEIAQINRNYLLGFYSFIACNKLILWLITYNYSVKPLSVEFLSGGALLIAIFVMLWLFLIYNFMVTSIQLVNCAKVDTFFTPFPTEFFILYLLLLKPLMQMIAVSWLNNSKKYSRNISGFLQLMRYTLFHPIPTALLSDPESLTYLIPSKKEIFLKYTSLGLAFLGVVNLPDWYKGVCEQHIHTQTMGQLCNVSDSVDTIARQDPQNPALQKACSDFYSSKAKAEHSLTMIQKQDNVVDATVALSRVARLRGGCIEPTTSSRQGIYDCIKKIAEYDK